MFIICGKVKPGSTEHLWTSANAGTPLDPGSYVAAIVITSGEEAGRVVWSPAAEPANGEELCQGLHEVVEGTRKCASIGLELRPVWVDTAGYQVSCDGEYLTSDPNHASTYGTLRPAVTLDKLTFVAQREDLVSQVKDGTTTHYRVTFHECGPAPRASVFTLRILPSGDWNVADLVGWDDNTPTQRAKAFARAVELLTDLDIKDADYELSPALWGEE